MMTDESPREVRPDLAPLRREVEPPRAASGLWLPFMALASAAMLTIVSGIAVMTRAPRAMVLEPATTPPMVEPTGMTAGERAKVERVLLEQSREEAARHQRRVMCRAPVHRGNIDGAAQPYDECIVPADVAARAKGLDAR